MRARQRGGEVAQVPRRRAAPAADRLVVVAGGGQPAVLAAEQRATRRRPRELEVLGVVDEHVAPARARRARARAGLSRSSATARSSEVAEVERALLGSIRSWVA